MRFGLISDFLIKTIIIKIFKRSFYFILFYFFRCLELDFEFLDMIFFNPLKLSLRMVVNSSA